MAAGQSIQTMLRTDAGTVVGTVAYMSPEQARGQDVDLRTDVWSLGVVLYEMVAGRSPFAAQSSSDVLVSILDREPAPLARFDPETSAELQRIVTKALRKDRGQRYQTVQDLLLDLQALGDDIHLSARTSDIKINAAFTPETLGPTIASTGTAQQPLASSANSVVPSGAWRPLLLTGGLLVLLGFAAAAWWFAWNPRNAPQRVNSRACLDPSYGEPDRIDADVCPHVARRPVSRLLRIRPVSRSGRRKAAKQTTSRRHEG